MRQNTIIANRQICRIINDNSKLDFQFILHDTISYMDFLPGLACEFNNYRDTVSTISDGSIRYRMPLTCTCAVYCLILQQDRIDGYGR